MHRCAALFCVLAFVAGADQARAFSAAAPVRHLRSTFRSTTVCTKMAADPVLDRRQALKAAAAGLGLIWQPVAPAWAFKQSKEELLLVAGGVQKEVKALKEGAALAESEWKPKDNFEAQKEYNVLFSLLRAGNLSQLRSTCFHLYRDHVVDATKFKAAEQLYKQLVDSSNDVNTLLLKASRDELKKDKILAISPAIAKLESRLEAFVAACR